MTAGALGLIGKKQIITTTKKRDLYNRPGSNYFITITIYLLFLFGKNIKILMKTNCRKINISDLV